MSKNKFRKIENTSFQIIFFYNFIIYACLLICNSSCSQNQAPRFSPPLQSNYFFPEFNSTKPGDVLLWLNATDYDDDDLQFGVEGDFHKKLINVKKMERNKAVVIAKQIFDREVQEKYENIVFYVQDKPGNKVYQSVRFVILDIDDNPPLFKNTPYKVNIIENQPINTIIFESVEAFDSDGPLYNKFSFNIVKKSSDLSDLFSIGRPNYISSGHFNTSIILNSKLDYEKSKTHVITLSAIGENSIHVSYAELVLNVVDYPDRQPEFSQSPYYVKIEEEMNVGDFVLQVSAKDGDTGINNPCKYKIVYESSLAASYFYIDKLKGDVRIKKKIDLESDEISRLGGLLEFKIIATEVGDENSQQETLVTVAISDVNDNQPKFNRNSYNLVISPKSTVGTSLTLTENDTDSIHVFDSDKGINGSFSLVLLKVIQNGNKTSYENPGDFEVIPKIALNDANLIIKVKNQINLMNKIGSIEHYRLFAKDKGINGNITHADLFIKIEIINQFAPHFEKELYTFYVDENAPYNTTIDYLYAYDNDTFDIYGRVTYEMKNGQDRFQIDKDTGRIFTICDNPAQELDRELIDTFYMSIDAIDGGGQRSSVQIIIKLNDLNDNAPQFLNNLFSLNGFTNATNISNNIIVGFIEENSAKWLEPIRLQAVDRDNGLNGEVIYEIIDGDFMKDFFKIDEMTNFIALKENMTLDFEELYRMRQQNNNSNSLLLPRQVNDLIMNTGEVDLNLIISAHDLGFPSLHSKIIAKIIVKDVNDHKPKFDNMFYSARVLETARLGDVIQLNATDLDAPNTPNSRINYRIESGSRDKFYIDSNTGVIKINENANLDKDLFGSSYSLKIIANDYGSLNLNDAHFKKSFNDSILTTDNTCYLRIDIIDVNNKMPVFTTNIETISISEGAPINSVLTQVKAEDSDTNSQLFYFLLNDNLDFNSSSSSASYEKFEAFNEYLLPINTNLVKNWFDIDSNNGTIYVRSHLDRELVEQVNLVIGVEDLNAANEYKPQIITKLLKVKILDVNDNYPMYFGLKQLNFNHSDDDEEPIFELYENIEENIRINSKVMQLKAFDLDKDRNITYRIIHSSDKSKSLALNQTTGDIYVKNPIDHEETKWINLTILTFDNGLPNRKHSILHLYFKINDVNDNQPKFVQLNTTEFRIYENAPINTVIANFKIDDPDSGLAGSVEYKIISGNDEKFGIDPVKGTLFVKSHIDREEQDTYTLIIQAKDNPNQSNQLTDSLLIKIKILDVNDNSPYCEQDFYSIETVQNIEINTTLLQIRGLDRDTGKNSKLTYSLNLMNDSDNWSENLFKINSKTGQILTNKKLIAHSGLYLFNLTITDSGEEVNEEDLNYEDLTSSIISMLQTNINRSGSCLVKIFVRPFNSHAPKLIFPNTNNSTQRIKSSLKIGDYILTVNATDDDEGMNGKISYKLDENRIKNDDWKSFMLDSMTGVLTLNKNLNINRQSLYSIDIIVSDHGKPSALQSRITLTLIVVDDSNNAAQFDRMKICLSSSYTCEKDFETVIVKLKEENISDANSISLNLARMNDLTKNDEDICYYLSGKDKNLFKLNQTSGILTPKVKLDREKREKYELIIKSSEYCYCLNSNGNKKIEPQCKQSNIFNDTYDSNDISQLKVNVYLEDINDNKPKFSKEIYQIGITTDIDYGETILESYALDLDSNSTLNFSIDKSTFKIIDSKKNIGNVNFLPFKIEYSPSQLVHDEGKIFKKAKFQIKSQKYFKEDQYFSNNRNTPNTIFQFSINVFDENIRKNQSALVQVILIKKLQRVKLVLSQPLDKVLELQEDFENYLTNLTGYNAYIDKISAHRTDEKNNNDDDPVVNSKTLTDMHLHFIQNSSRLIDFDLIERNMIKPKNNSLEFDENSLLIDNPNRNFVVDAEKIINLLDKSKDVGLLKKYKLSLAEKYDDNGGSTFYKYGSSIDDDYGNFFLWTPSSKGYNSFTSRMILIIFSAVLLFFSFLILIVCYFMRKKYLRKLKAERAMTKAFGFEQRSLTFNDAMAGYINSAFDSNNLLPIPGTNLYAYEGSNPIWLKKYDKIETKTDSSSASSTSSKSKSSHHDMTACLTNHIDDKSKQRKSNNDDISSFYLKQVENTPVLSRSSPLSGSNHTDKNNISKTENVTLTSDILSIQDVSPPINDSTNSSNNLQELNIKSTFKTDTLLTFATSNSINDNPQSNKQLNKTANNNNLIGSASTNIQLNESLTLRAQFKSDHYNAKQLNTFQANSNNSNSIGNTNYTKIFDNSFQSQDSFMIVNQQANKDQITNQLFAVESTII